MVKHGIAYLDVEPNLIRETGFHKDRSKVSESLFSLSNEYMGVRGYFEEGCSGAATLRGNYVNGLYAYALKDEPTSYRGIETRTHFMVNTVDFLGIELWADGERLDLGTSSFSSFTRCLPFREGKLTRSFVWELRNGKKVKVSFERFLSLSHYHLCLQRVSLESGEEVSISLSFKTGNPLLTWGDHAYLHEKAREVEKGLLCYETENTEQMAYIAFNPSAVSPAQTDNQYLQPHAGAKFLASFVGANYTEDGQNDDWFISPELTFAGDFGFSFYAKSYFEGQDKFSVGYAIESDPATDDFVWLAENVAASRQDWVEYSYTIPAAAKHVAIRNVSTEQEGFILMIDDVKIGPMPAVARLRSASAVQMPAVAYEVFLDGQSQGETTEISWQFDDLAAGEHTAGVKSVYNSGESEMMTITFDTRTLGIDDVQGNMVNVYPNPVSDRLTVEGEYTRLLFTNMGGATVMMLDGKQSTVDVSSLPAGMYILTIIDDNAGTRSTRKVTVVR